MSLYDTDEGELIDLNDEMISFETIQVHTEECPRAPLPNTVAVDTKEIDQELEILLNRFLFDSNTKKVSILAYLPSKLLQKVFRYVDLPPLFLVNKHWSKTAIEMFYENINLDSRSLKTILKYKKTKRLTIPFHSTEKLLVGDIDILLQQLNLDYLKIQGNISNMVLQSITDNQSDLKELSLQGSFITDSCLPLLKKLKLQSLSITFGLVTCSTLLDLISLGLNELVLNNLIQSEFVFRGIECSNLQRLSITHSEITNIEVIHITKYLSSLTSIQLDFCLQISDESIVALTCNCPELVSISLSFCLISNLSLSAIIQNCKKLRNLIMNGNDKITPDYIQKLCSELDLFSLSLHDCKQILNSFVLHYRENSVLDVECLIKSNIKRLANHDPNAVQKALHIKTEEPEEVEPLDNPLLGYKRHTTGYLKPKIQEKKHASMSMLPRPSTPLKSGIPRPKSSTTAISEIPKVGSRLSTITQSPTTPSKTTLKPFSTPSRSTLSTRTPTSNLTKTPTKSTIKSSYVTPTPIRSVTQTNITPLKSSLQISPKKSSTATKSTPQSKATSQLPTPTKIATPTRLRPPSVIPREEGKVRPFRKFNPDY
ncbi:hypothetical protein HDV06_002727 [Boothiomyces sp. JEL0866]|nr:hypothetical protein HDV06_002727 [Boothiomyces sp. JEL0866]